MRIHLNFFAFTQTHSLGTATVVSPSLLSGWDVRPYDWQFSASVQQQLMPRVSAEFGYSRRSWGNFTLTHRQPRGRGDGLRHLHDDGADGRATAEQRPADLVSRC